MPRLLACLVGLGAGGCGVFNPAFVDLLDPAGTGQFATLDNAPGHVVITFVNNAEVGERVIACMERVDCGCLEAEDCQALSLTEAEKRALRPRMRLQVRVTFTDGSFQLIEFVDGSGNLVKPNFDAQALPDLNQNDLDTVVVVCNVARVEVVDPIEVFVPVAWKVHDFVDPTGLTPGFYRVTREERPKFVALQVDEVDEDLNTVLRRNIGIRDAPVAVDDPLCGSVVAIILNGVLSVPFFQAAPGYDILDAETAASIGGRYEFLVSVK